MGNPFTDRYNQIIENGSTQSLHFQTDVLDIFLRWNKKKALREKKNRGQKMNDDVYELIIVELEHRDCIPLRRICSAWKEMVDSNLRKAYENKVLNVLQHCSIKCSVLPIVYIMKWRFGRRRFPYYKCAVCGHPVSRVGECNRIHFTYLFFMKRTLLPPLISLVILFTSVFMLPMKCRSILRRVHVVNRIGIPALSSRSNGSPMR